MTARRIALGNAAEWLRAARRRLHAGNVPGALFLYGEARESLGVALGLHPARGCTATLRPLLDAFLCDLRAVLEPPPQVAGDRLARVLFEALMVLKTRDFVPVDEALLRERANNAAMAVLDAFAVSMKPWAAAEAVERSNAATGSARSH